MVSLGSAYMPAYYAPYPYGYTVPAPWFPPPVAPLPYPTPYPLVSYGLQVWSVQPPLPPPPFLALQQVQQVAATRPTIASPPASIKEIKASHILVNTQDEAQRHRQKILSGQTRFEDIAKQVSNCPSGKEGGDLGFFERGQMVPEFDKVAFKLPVGVISEPIKTDFGWHLIKVTEQR